MPEGHFGQNDPPPGDPPTQPMNANSSENNPPDSNQKESNDSTNRPEAFNASHHSNQDANVPQKDTPTSPSSSTTSSNSKKKNFAGWSRANIDKWASNEANSINRNRIPANLATSFNSMKNLESLSSPFFKIVSANNTVDIEDIQDNIESYVNAINDKISVEAEASRLRLDTDAMATSLLTGTPSKAQYADILKVNNEHIKDKWLITKALEQLRIAVLGSQSPNDSDINTDSNLLNTVYPLFFYTNDAQEDQTSEIRRCGIKWLDNLKVNALSTSFKTKNSNYIPDSDADAQERDAEIVDIFKVQPIKANKLDNVALLKISFLSKYHDSSRQVMDIIFQNIEYETIDSSPGFLPQSQEENDLNINSFALLVQLKNNQAPRARYPNNSINVQIINRFKKCSSCHSLNHTKSECPLNCARCFAQGHTSTTCYTRPEKVTKRRKFANGSNTNKSSNTSPDDYRAYGTPNTSSSTTSQTDQGGFSKPKSTTQPPQQSHSSSEQSSNKSNPFETLANNEPEGDETSTDIDDHEAIFDDHAYNFHNDTFMNEDGDIASMDSSFPQSSDTFEESINDMHHYNSSIKRNLLTSSSLSPKKLISKTSRTAKNNLTTAQKHQKFLRLSQSSSNASQLSGSSFTSNESQTLSQDDFRTPGSSQDSLKNIEPRPLGDTLQV